MTWKLHFLEAKHRTTPLPELTRYANTWSLSGACGHVMTCSQEADIEQRYATKDIERVTCRRCLRTLKNRTVAALRGAQDDDSP